MNCGVHLSVCFHWAYVWDLSLFWWFLFPLHFCFLVQKSKLMNWHLTGFCIRKIKHLYSLTSTLRCSMGVFSLCQTFFALLTKYVQGSVSRFLEIITSLFNRKVQLNVALKPKQSMGHESRTEKSWDFMKSFSRIYFTQKVIKIQGK